MYRRESLIAFFIIAAVFGLVAFGPSFMAHGMNHSGDCPIASFSGSSCFTIGSFLDHLSVISGVLEAVIQQAGGMLTVVVAILAGAATLWTVLFLLVIPDLRRVRQERRSAVRLSLRGFFRWNSLLAHSPTLC